MELSNRCVCPNWLWTGSETMFITYTFCCYCWGFGHIRNTKQREGIIRWTHLSPSASDTHTYTHKVKYRPCFVIHGVVVLNDLLHYRHKLVSVLRCIDTPSVFSTDKFSICLFVWSLASDVNGLLDPVHWLQVDDWPLPSLCCDFSQFKNILESRQWLQCPLYTTACPQVTGVPH